MQNALNFTFNRNLISRGPVKQKIVGTGQRRDTALLGTLEWCGRGIVAVIAGNKWDEIKIIIHFCVYRTVINRNGGLLAMMCVLGVSSARASLRAGAIHLALQSQRPKLWPKTSRSSFAPLTVFNLIIKTTVFRLLNPRSWTEKPLQSVE